MEIKRKVTFSVAQLPDLDVSVNLSDEVVKDKSNF
jgi:hypothetical protein